MKSLPRPKSALDLPHPLVTLSSPCCPAQFTVFFPKRPAHKTFWLSCHSCYGLEPRPWQPRQVGFGHPPSIDQLKKQVIAKSRRFIHCVTLGRRVMLWHPRKSIFDVLTWGTCLNRGQEACMAKQSGSPARHHCLGSDLSCWGSDRLSELWDIPFQETNSLWLALGIFNCFLLPAQIPGKILISYSSLFQ